MDSETDTQSQVLQPEAIHMAKPKAPKWDQHLIDFFLFLFTILLFVALLAHGYVGIFTRYVADDYCTASAVRTTGLLSTQKFYYLAWSGRFSFTLAVSVLSLIGHQIVPILPALALGLLLVGLTWTISKFRSIVTSQRPILTSLLLAELIIFVTITDNPGGVSEALYWQTGMVTYWFPLIFMVGYVGFVKYVDGSKTRVRPGALYLFWGAALTFIAGGFNETYAFFQMCALLVAIGWCLWTKRFMLLQLLVAGFIGSVLSAAIVSVAPGNSVRRAYFPPPPGWLRLLKGSAESTVSFMFSEQNYPNTYLYKAVALLIPALLALYTPPRERGPTARDLFMARKQTWLAILIFVLICFGVIMSCFVPAMYAMSKPPPHRALVIPEFVLISLLAAWSYYLGHLFRHRYLEGRRRFPLLTGVSVVLAASLAIAPIQAARRTFSKAARVRALAAMWDKQDQEIRALRDHGETNLTVPVAYNIGGTDIMTGNPQWYVNQCVAAYYGVNRITATPSIEGLRIISNVPQE